MAKLPSEQQAPALRACFKKMYNGGEKPTRVLLPVRNLQFSTIYIPLSQAPVGTMSVLNQAIPLSWVIRTEGQSDVLFQSGRSSRLQRRQYTRRQ
jgi:hypothetical protein